MRGERRRPRKSTKPLFKMFSSFFGRQQDLSTLDKIKAHLIHIFKNEKAMVEFLSQFMIASAIITFISFTFLGIRASYGRYSPESAMSRFTVPARWAWFIQELPSLLLPLFPIWQIGIGNIPTANMVALFMFIGHYSQRSLIYPFLIREGKPTPIHLLFLGTTFCCWNGYIQGFFHAKYAQYPNGHFWTIGSLFGIPLFLIGMFINIQADHILRSLRRSSEKGYKIPYGGMFEYVSGANFFGEILEWIGYALFAQTQTAFAFALFTASNTIPRAREHHRWYLNKFKGKYPPNRTAVIPFIY